MNAFTLDELVLAATDWRREGSVIVLACGCFDPLHVGHVQHLKAAKALGNVLVVAVTADEHVRAAKGPGRPRSPAGERAEVISALRFVDAVVINPNATGCGVIRTLRPHVYVKGAEFRNPDCWGAGLSAEVACTHLFGGRVEFISGVKVRSSTAILAGV